MIAAPLFALDDLYIGRTGQAIIIWLTDHLKRFVVVMHRHGRWHLPFGRTRIPDVTLRLLAVLDAAEEVDQENQDGKGNEESRDGHNEMIRVQTERRVIIHNTAAHAEHLLFCFHFSPPVVPAMDQSSQ